MCVGNINENSDRQTIFISTRQPITYCKYETHVNNRILFLFPYENHTRKFAVLLFLFSKEPSFFYRVIITNHTPDLLL